MCARLLKGGAAELAPSLTALFNKSLQDAVLPLDWVSANVCPIYKKGDKHCVSVSIDQLPLYCLLLLMIGLDFSTHIIAHIAYSWTCPRLLIWCLTRGFC